MPEKWQTAEIAQTLGAPALIARHLSAVCDADAEADGATVPEQANVNLFLNGRQAYEVDEVHVVLDPDAIKLQDHVTDKNAGLLRRGIAGNAADAGSFRPRHAELCRFSGAERRIEPHAKVGPRDGAAFNELICDHHDHVDRNRETDAFVRSACAGDGRVQADYFAAQIQQRAATVAWIDGCIGLQKILILHSVI